MQPPALVPVVEGLPVPLDPVASAKHNWLTDFVNFKAGLVPATLTQQEAIRYQIAAIEQLLTASVEAGATEANHDTYPLRHTFAPGVYLRELTIPAGNFVVGKLHKHSHANFLSRGKVSVLTEAGGWEILTAPCTLISPAGVKRLLFTHEDTIWTVIHPTDLTNLDEIEAAVIAKCYTEIGMAEPQLMLPFVTEKESA